MATTLSELIIIVRAKADSISSDIERSIRKAQGNFQAQGKAIGVALGAGLTAAMGTVVAAVKRGVDQVDALSAAAQKVGVSTNGLAQLQLAAKLTDSSFEGLTQGIGRMSAAIATGKADNALAKLKLDAIEIRKLAPEQQFQRIAGALGQISDKGAQLALGKEIFGRGFVEFANLAEAGTAKLQEMNRIAEVLGLTVSEKMVGAINEFDNATHIAVSAWDGFSRQLAGEVAPLMSGLSQMIVDQVESWGGMNAVAQQVAGAVQSITGFILDAAFGARQLIVAFDLLVAKCNEVQLGIAEWTTKGIANALRGIAEMTRALATMVRENEAGFRAMINTVLGLIRTGVQALIDGVTKAVETSTNTLRTAYSGVSSLWGGEPLSPVSLTSPQIAPFTMPEGSGEAASNALFVAGTAIDASAESVEKLNQALLEGQGIARGTGDELKKMLNEPAWGQTFQARAEANKNLIFETQQAAQQSILDVSDANDKTLKGARERHAKTVRDMADNSSSAFRQMQEANQAVVTDVVAAWITGTGKMSDIINAWAQQSLKRIIDVLLFGTRGSFGGFGGGGGGGGGMNWAGLVGSVAGIFAGAGSATASAGSIASFAEGGNFQGGRPMLVGERGAEIMLPRSSGTIIPNRAMQPSGGGNATIVHVTQNFQVGVSRIEMMSMQDQLQEMTKQGVLDAVERGGSFRRRMRS